MGKWASCLHERDGLIRAVRNLPAMTAQCVHIWQTGNSEIADFHSGGSGHVVLKEDTYCGGETPCSPLAYF